MEQSTAQALLFHDAANLVILGLPAHSDFGVGFSEWETGPQFMGVKFLPPGLHFVHYRYTNFFFSALLQWYLTKAGNRPALTSERTADQAAPHDFRSGFFRWFAAGETVVCEWDPATEQLRIGPNDDDDEDEDGSSLDRAQVARVRANLRGIDRHLGAFPHAGDAQRRWTALTSRLTPAVLTRVLPASPRRPRFHVLASDPPSSSTVDIVKGDAEPIAGQLQFTPIDLKRSWDTTAVPPLTPSQISHHARDKSWLLESTVARCGGSFPSALMAEMELAFVVLLVGHNFDGFEHWKRIMHLVCLAEDTVAVHPDWLLEFLEVLQNQLQECPADFFVDLLSRDNFIVKLLNTLARSIRTLSHNNDPLARAIHEFSDFVGDRFGLVIGGGHSTPPTTAPNEDDGEDDQPVIVDLDGSRF
ncbi:A1 cistron-splicing factor [Blastocladiella britannica]|nr:A1 cistron-splicing factor [Blastocladiella britannica]